MHTVIVGAGIAGLNSARYLAQSGQSVTVLEKNSKPGGRIATDYIDGFTCDVGFQLLNPQYPEAKKSLNLPALDLHAFSRGAVICEDDRQFMLSDPTRHPLALPSLLRECSVTDARAAYSLLKDRESTTFDQALERAGFSASIERAARTFLAAVTADSSLECTPEFGRKLIYYFLKGSPSLPAQGMEAIAYQMADLDGVTIRYSTEIVEIIEEDQQVLLRCSDGKDLHADRVIVAGGPLENAYLLDSEVPATGDLTTWWFAADQRPTASTYLHLDCSDSPLINHAAVVSNVCPSYAPAGQHLIQASVVGSSDLEAEVVAQRVQRMFGCEGDTWRLLTCHRVSPALPIMTGRSAWSPTGKLAVAGDFNQASIQGALASGRQAASLSSSQ